VRFKVSRPLRILTLSTLFPAETRPNFGIFVERQTAALAALPDFDVTVINPIGIAPWPLNMTGSYTALKALPDHEQWRGINVHRPRFMAIPKVGGRLNPAMIASAVLPLARRLHAEKSFDLIDAEFFYPDGPAAMRLSDALGIPFTIKARGSDIHHWGHQQVSAPQLLQAADKAAGLLSVSEALKSDMAALGIDAAKITVHYTGLDQSRFKPRDQLEEKTRLGITGALVLCIGALIVRKNQRLLIEALPQLPGATLMLVGQGPVEQAYRALATRLGVADRVRFMGNVPHHDLPAIFAAADVMALLSENEGLANAWVEALACGTPVVASDVGGIRELIKTADAGRIVERNPAAIATAITDLLANPPSREAVAANVRAFSWDENARTLAAFFRNIVAA
jgi:teichuronic acid biosynthesis glycosyltransferase TuaC